MNARTDVESQLEGVEGKLASASSRLDQLVLDFALSIAPDVSSWIEQAAVRKLEENHEKVNAGGLEFVRMFKADVTELSARATAICEEAIGKQDQWPHHRDLVESDFYSSRTDFFGAIYKRAVSSLGDVLNKHGLIGARDGSWQRVRASHYEYAYHTGFDARKYEEVEAYRLLLREHFALKSEVARLVAEIQKAKARALWDEAP
ncbi:hypothetical protein [Stenotrophomonas maltophilia]|uniref:hypothetical protein n=1 Tax=Stenotrophomonas maltophilia TaxID=40324 RepID=UPI002114177E|nr:hypothetical protein [Stenotrophomonas maltophilia]